MPIGKGRLRIAIEDFLEGYNIGTRVAKWMTDRLNDAESALKPSTQGGLKSEYNLPLDPPDWLDNLLRKNRVGLLAIAGFVLGGFMSFGGSLVTATLDPYFKRLSYDANRKLPSHRLDPSALYGAMRRDVANADKYLAHLADLGVDETGRSALSQLYKQYLTAHEYAVLWRRGLLGDNDLIERLSRLGFDTQEIEGIKQLTNIIPSPSDLIMMSVKEAFNDEFARRFATDEDLPPEFVTWADRQGVGLEWAKRYWRSHWQLPSPQQVFEMLHRLRPGTTGASITRDDVDAYLKAADYSPYWRERLSLISYSPYTRVDIRRMYRIGVLSEEEVYSAYLDLGYDETRARKLTEFTTAYEAEEESGVVKSSVLEAYGGGMIDRSTADGMLAKGGYDEVTRKFYLDSVDFRETLRVKQIKVSDIRKRYLEGLIDDLQASAEIGRLNLPAERSDALLALWLTERETQSQILSIPQMEVLLERGIVTEDEFIAVASRRGYDMRSINWTLTRIAQEAAERAQKETDRAAAENLKISRSTLSSEYQRGRAMLDLQIAQARAEITDINIALRGEISDEDADDLIKRRDELTSRIASLNVEKAQLKLTLESQESGLTAGAAEFPGESE